MDLTSGLPVTLVTAEASPPFRQLDGDVRCEVCVIGGGITGALAAYHLSKAGADVVLVDRREFGHGSTAASTGLLQYEIDTSLQELIQRKGKMDGVRCYQLCRETNAQIGDLANRLGHTGYRPCGSLYLASSRAAVEKLRIECRLRQKAGFRVEFLDETELQLRFSISRPGAIHSVEAGWINAFSFSRRLLEAAGKQGLRAFDRTEVSAKKAGRSGWTLVTDRAARIRCQRVVLAAGYETVGFLKAGRVKLKSTFAIASDPPPHFDGWTEDCVIWETARPYLYMAKTEDGRILMGGEDIDDPDPVIRKRILRKKSRRLEARFSELFPEIEFVQRFSWAGTFAETEDGLPYIGTCPEVPNAWFALGYGANGITFSMIAARIITDAFHGKKNPDARLFRFER